MNNKNKEVLEYLIIDYLESLDIYNAKFRDLLLDKKQRKEVLINMQETAYKLHLACADLRKEIK